MKNLSELRKKLNSRSQIILKTDKKYEETRKQFAFYENSKLEADENITPLIIIIPFEESDVTQIIKFSIKNNYLLVVRSGGHQYSGLSSSSSSQTKTIQIDLKNFSYLKIEDDALKISEDTKITSKQNHKVIMGASTRLNKLYQVLHRYNLFVPAGICVDVGVGGHFQSSALGFLSKSFGLGIDFVTRIRIALPENGKIVDATPISYSDLFWAVLGGSPGSFGCVLEYEINAFNALKYEDVYAIRYTWTYSDETFREVMNNVLKVAKHKSYTDLDDPLVYLAITPDFQNPYLASSENNPQVHVITAMMLWTGTDVGSIYKKIPKKYLDEKQEEGLTFHDFYIKSFQNIHPRVDPDKFSVDLEYKKNKDHTISYIMNVMTAPVATGNLKAYNDDIYRMLNLQKAVEDEEKRKSEALARECNIDIHTENARYSNIAKFTSEFNIDKTFTEMCIKRMNTMLENPHLWFTFQFNTFGGKLAANTGINSFPLRNIKTGIDLWLSWRESLGEKIVSDAKKWIDKTDELLESEFGSKSVNLILATYGDLNINNPKVRKRYYPNDFLFNRLRQVKTKYDPHNLFKTKFSIPPFPSNEKEKTTFSTIPTDKNLDNIVGKLIENASLNPDKPYLTWINNNGFDTPITFGEFKGSVIKYAAWLRKSKAVQKGDNLVLCYVPGTEFFKVFMACIYLGAIPIPVYPFNPIKKDRFYDNFIHIVNNCKPKYILTDKPFNLQRKTSRLFNYDYKSDLSVNWIVAKKMNDEYLDIPKIELDDPAFIQYTSGTTDHPKGVIITHRNLIHQFKIYKDELLVDENTKGLIWVPQYHDFGLISSLLGSLVGNCQLAMMSPQLFIKTPSIWFDSIHKFRATHTAAPNFAYSFCLSKINEQQRKKWDLSCLKVLMSAAEPIDHKMMSKFLKAFEISNLNKKAYCPAYGLAENTVGVTLFGSTVLWLNKNKLVNNEVVIESESEDSIAITGCGKLLEEVPVTIVIENTALEEGEIGEIGEIWISGYSTSKGYINNDKLTKSNFNLKLEGHLETWVKTGDIGFIFNNELFVLGRVADTIYQNSKTFYPHHLEIDINSSSELIRKGSTVAFKLNNDSIGIGIELREEISKEKQKDLVDLIFKTIKNSFNVTIGLISILKKGSVIKTSSGKICRFKTGYAIKHNQLTQEIYRQSSLSLSNKSH